MNKPASLAKYSFSLFIFLTSCFLFLSNTQAATLPISANKENVKKVVQPVKKTVTKPVVKPAPKPVAKKVVAPVKKAAIKPVAKKAVVAKKPVVAAKPVVVQKYVPPKIGGYEIAGETGIEHAIKNQDTPYPVASLTKMMTALVFSENRKLGWNDTVTYNAKRHFVYGNFLKFRNGESMTVNDLLTSMLVESINEPAEMLVEATDMQDFEFVKLMNQKAKDLGMTKTTYVDPSGISPKNVSSPNDQVKLLKAVYEKEGLRKIMDTEKVEVAQNLLNGTVKTKLLKHTNSLVGGAGFEILASKTGYLWEANNCMAMVIQKNGQVFYVVTLNDPSRYRDFTNTKVLIDKTLAKI